MRPPRAFAPPTGPSAPTPSHTPPCSSRCPPCTTSRSHLLPAAPPPPPSPALAPLTGWQRPCGAPPGPRIGGRPREQLGPGAPTRRLQCGVFMAGVQVCRWKGPWRVHVGGPALAEARCLGGEDGQWRGHARGAPATTPRTATCARVTGGICSWPKWLRTGLEQASIPTDVECGSVHCKPDDNARRHSPCPRPAGHPGIGIKHPLGTV